MELPLPVMGALALLLLALLRTTPGTASLMNTDVVGAVKSAASIMNPLPCMSKYCPPTYQIQVDRWDSAQGTDQSMLKGMDTTLVQPTLKDVYNANRLRYEQLAQSHPGVRLVGHAVH